VAADLLSQHCWSENTWATRSSQWRKWVGFCEQDERSIFPTSEGDILAYIGLLRLDGKVSAASLPQYLSAVSRYHDFAGMASPTKTVLVRSKTRAYDRAFDLNAFSRPTRVGLWAVWMRRVLSLGLETHVPTLIRIAAMVMFMFLFGCQESTAVSLRDSDLTVTDERVTAVLVQRKGKRTQGPWSCTTTGAPQPLLLPLPWRSRVAGRACARRPTRSLPWRKGRTSPRPRRRRWSRP
jgi:site-specific recombinase XerD